MLIIVIQWMWWHRRYIISLWNIAQSCMKGEHTLVFSTTGSLINLSLFHVKTTHWVELVVYSLHQLSANPTIARTCMWFPFRPVFADALKVEMKHPESRIWWQVQLCCGCDATSTLNLSPMQFVCANWDSFAEHAIMEKKTQMDGVI